MCFAIWDTALTVLNMNTTEWWITKHGLKIRIVELTDDHLQRIVDAFHRVAERYEKSVRPEHFLQTHPLLELSGEEAMRLTETFDEYWDDYEPDDDFVSHKRVADEWLDSNASYQRIKKEFDRRKRLGITVTDRTPYARAVFEDEDL